MLYFHKLCPYKIILLTNQPSFMLQLNLPEFKYKIKQKDGRLFIFDEARKKFVTLTPEEWVRQHFLHFLLNEKKISLSLISMEYGSKYNTTLDKRCDILVWNNDMKPLLMVECKAPHVLLCEKTAFQLGCYNSEMQVPHLAITNGISHFYFKKQEGELYKKVEDLVF